MRRRSRLGIGHAGKCTTKVSTRASLMGGFRLVEGVNQLGRRLEVRSAESPLRIALRSGDGDVPVSSLQRRPLCLMCGFVITAKLR
jgi:hypothetical protein